MSRSRSQVYSFGHIDVPSISINKIDLDITSASQATSVTSGVAVSSLSGIITTISATIPAAAANTFAVTNSLITPSSLVLANLVGGNMTTGNPSLAVTNVTAGGFSVVLANNASAGGTSMTGQYKIGYQVFI